MSEEMMDPEVFKEYLAEVFESLDGLDEKFVALEQSPKDTKIIDSIFRPVHSIKGSSAFFGLNHVKGFSHKLENLLDDLRKEVRAVTPVIIDNLLKGTDFLKAMFQRVVAGDMNFALTPEETQFIEGLDARIGAKGEEAAKEKEEEVHTLETCFLKMSALVEKYKKSANPDAALVAEFEAALGLVHKVAAVVPAPATPSAPAPAAPAPKKEGEAEEEPKVEKLGEILISSGKVSAEKMAEAMKQRMEGEKLGALLVRTGVASEEVVREAMDSQARQAEEAAKTKSAVKKTMRIEEEKVDEFMRQIGELVIISETFNYLEKRLDVIPGASAVSKEFKNANIAFSELTYQLQHGLSEVRKVSIKGLFQKVPRIIRDTATFLGKSANVEIIGDDVMLDKSLLEKLESPIVHMVRNAIDHGVEMPDKREAAGKNKTGTIQISAEIKNDSLLIVLKDDGAGLARNRILQKAIGKQLVTPQAGELLPDKDVFDFIFAPGFSTAEKVTDISGRGVGMDVVRSALADVKGKIEIQSREGFGTTFTISLPITTTLVTINGLVVAVGRLKFILPVEDVKESIRPTREEIFTVREDGEMVNIRGNLYPLVRLYQNYRLDTEVQDPVAGVGIIIEKSGKKCCIMADAIVEQQNVVLKDLGRPFRQVKSIVGGAILGDGSIGLVINVEGLMEKM
ncbi:MAG: chemotaxis protein CheA [Nitrospinae bacterium]|nr:chemotaxis protein CheA [Nitrospinota bacterium]